MTNYTLAELQAMPNDGLNALAAEMRGAKLSEDDYWIAEGLCVIRITWTPATDRNQSGELLEWAAAQGIVFDIAFGHYAPDERHPHIEAYWPVYNKATWRSENKWLYHIPGNDARAETIAFCAAMLAMKGRLK